MSHPEDVTKPESNAEKFKPQHQQDDGKFGNDAAKRRPDVPQGSEHHLQRKSMHRQ